MKHFPECYLEYACLSFSNFCGPAKQIYFSSPHRFSVSFDFSMVFLCFLAPIRFDLRMDEPRDDTVFLSFYVFAIVVIIRKQYLAVCFLNGDRSRVDCPR